jgi:hypothetical protein
MHLNQPILSQNLLFTTLNCKYFVSKSPGKNYWSQAKYYLLKLKSLAGFQLKQYTFISRKLPRCLHCFHDSIQGVVYQLDVAMEDPATQRAGIVFIYNMSGETSLWNQRKSFDKKLKKSFDCIDY